MLSTKTAIYNKVSCIIVNIIAVLFALLFYSRYVYELSYEQWMLSIVFLCSGILYGIYTISDNHLGQLICLLLNGFLASIVVLTDNIIIQYASIEIISIFSTYIMYIDSSNRIYKNDIMMYCVLHFGAGVLILGGISDYCDGENICNANNIIENISNFNMNMLLCGLLINVASFPLCNWIFSYAKGGKITLLFLQLFSSKSALIMLYNIMHNNDILIPFGIATSLYGLCNILLQRKINNKILISYSLLQLGITVSAIGFGSKITPYIISSILYQSLLYLLYININKNKNIIYYIGLIVSISSSLSFPFTGNFLSKYILMSNVYSIYVYYFLTIISYISAAYLAILYFNSVFDKEGDDLQKKSGAKDDIIIAILSVSCVIPIVSEMDGYTISNIVKQMVFSFGSIMTMNYFIKYNVIDKIDYLKTLINRLDLFYVIVCFLSYLQFWCKKILCMYNIFCLKALKILLNYKIKDGNKIKTQASLAYIMMIFMIFLSFLLAKEYKIF